MSSLALTKLVSGAQAAKVNGGFAFAIDGGGNVKADLGNQCRVSETSAATARSGSTWDSPVYDTNPVVIGAAGSTASVKVTNVLKTRAPTNPERPRATRLASTSTRPTAKRASSAL